MVEAQPTYFGDAAARELLSGIRRRVRLPPHVAPEDSVQAVMCTLSQHVAWTAARRLFEALPRRLRSVMDRCPRHREVPPSWFDRAELRDRVGEHLHVSSGDAEDLISATLATISAHLGGDATRIAAQLPRDLQSLWVTRRVASPSQTHPVIRRIEERVAPDGVDGLVAFATVMGLLTRRLPRAEAGQVVDSLPRDLAGLIEDYLDDREEPPVRFHLDEFLGVVAQELTTDDVDEAERAAREVFNATRDYLRTEIFERVMRQLPADLEELWAGS